MHMAMNIMGGIPPPSMQAPIFSVPQRLVFHGSMDDARSRAKSQRKWLLVNIQDYQEFQSVVLNRDLWSNDMIIDFLQDNFVFWQRELETPDAARFMALYKEVQRPFPFVGLVDPRTGGLMKTLKLKDKEDTLRMIFIEQVTGFMETHSLDDRKTTPPFHALPAPSASRMPPLAMPPPRSSSHAYAGADDGDDPELAAAIRASLEGGDMMEQVESSSAPRPLPQSAPPALPALSADPGSQPGTCRIRVRLPDGKMLARSFWPTDPVSQVFAFAAHALGHTHFDLVLPVVPPLSLRDRAHDTIATAQLANSSLNVRVL